MGLRGDAGPHQGCLLGVTEQELLYRGASWGGWVGWNRSAGECCDRVNGASKVDGKCRNWLLLVSGQLGRSWNDILE